MKKATIAIDIDDVLADNAAGFVAFSNEKWGTDLRPEDYDEHWAKVWQVDNEEVERRATALHESGVLNTYRHNDSAMPVLKRLSVNYNLIIVTSRRLQVRADTQAWIHKHYPGIFTDETIHFAGIWDSIDDQSIHRTKADVVEALGADYLIDDQLKHCQAVAATGRKAILFGDYTWNQADELPDGIIRLKDWAAVEEYFTDESRR
jgi:5'(3')-deoxyribonucleotidase